MGVVSAAGSPNVRDVEPLRTLRVLFVEDSLSDVDLLGRELRRAGFDVAHERVQDGEALRAALADHTWDLILSDDAMPGFDAAHALEIVRASGKDIPLIVVSGTIGEEAAVRLMKEGAQDFILKDRVARLGPAVQRELREAEGRCQRRLDAQARLDSQMRLEQAHRRLSVLSRRVLEAQEGERASLARDLHDGVGQLLTALQLQIEVLRRRSANPADLRSLDECLALVGQVLDHVRGLSLDLRPPQLDSLGLAAALRWFAERKFTTAGIELDFESEPLPPVDQAVETACFRIVQEALTNVLRHARARRVEIRLHARQGRLYAVVADDGVGFQVGEQYERSIRGESSGLLNMQERASLVGGRLELKSGAEGTRVSLDLPFQVDPLP